MAGTWRKRVVWVSDAQNGVEVAGHNHCTRGSNKKRDRRVKRREHSEITRQATASWYADAKEDLMDYLNLDELYADMWDDYMFQPYIEEKYDYVDDYEEDYRDLLDYYDHGDYWRVDDHSIAQTGPVADLFDRRIALSDAGKTLGELVQEFLSSQEPKG